MIQVTVITVGGLKESYWRDAVAEYEKRLSAFCKPTILQLKEARLPEDPSQGEVRAALAEEGKRILAAIPPRAYCIALCVEGKQLSSEALAARLGQVLAENGQLCLIIGSSHGLAEEVKAACRMRLSVSELTFPHQMMRVLLLEVLYRCFSILKGTKYHK
ncbi:MAG: 23S rRNA (pseudouridine(1915)-N(3))-methyltransferase RlmH [Clostridia bacterium]|nr:23S rRNA (pseudouridine(1915)-N(3))-methyltransferase RlmH [Clostridia bacterium]MBQ1962526.1 23S rRNA (pseudouridine(1915)-N(3))-methyltransferase RlmH [Clostridia bacterium]MBQ5833735.1 23S rRNA (pseudouridine(1915)-N(3))-methyltransferase RlmH [Clostridia bacterium]